MAETSTPRRSVLLRGASLLAGGWVVARTAAALGLGVIIEACSAPVANKYGGPPPDDRPRAKYGGPAEPLQPQPAPEEPGGQPEKYGGPPGGPSEAELPQADEMAKKHRPRPAKYGGPPKPPKPAPPKPDLPKPKYGGPPQADKYGGPPGRGEW